MLWGFFVLFFWTELETIRVIFVWMLFGSHSFTY